MQVLDVGSERVADAGIDLILDALTGEFGHEVAGIVDPVQVAVPAADHDIGAAAAIEDVTPVPTRQQIARPVAGEPVTQVVADTGLGAPLQGQVFHVAGRM
jgi:hypothetical protein